MLKPSDINLLKDIAVKIEETHIDASLDLMKLAKQLRPNGKLISRKCAEYEKKLDDRVKNSRQLVSDAMGGVIQSEVLSKKIWMYWHAGLDSAPKIVRQAYDTWRRNNPDYEVIFLDDVSLKRLLGINADDIRYLNPDVQLGMAGISDLIRLLLLYIHGGVWADATTFCNASLSDWLDISGSGMFIFRQPRQANLDRSMISWFMASVRGGQLIEALLADSLAFIIRDRADKLALKHLAEEERASVHCSRDGSGYKLLDICEKKGYVPYFWMFYLWNEVKAKSGNEMLYSLMEDKENNYQRGNYLNIETLKARVLKNTYKAKNNNAISDYRYNLFMGKLPHTKFSWRSVSPNAQISEKNKLIFVHIPKAGGTSIDNSNIFESRRAGHHSYNDMKLLLGERAAEFKVLALVRNPWDRLASAFYYLSEGGSNAKDEMRRERYLSEYNHDFKLFLSDFLENPARFTRLLHMKPMVSFLRPDEVSQPLLIKKLEEIGDKRDIDDFVGEEVVIAHDRKRKSYANVSKVYEPHSFLRVREIYLDDVVAFGYERFTLDDVSN